MRRAHPTTRFRARFPRRNTRARGRVLDMFPHQPRSLATMVSGIEFGPFLEGVGGLPESFVPITEQPALPGQCAADVFDEVSAGRKQVENLLGEHEESAVLPNR